MNGCLSAMTARYDFLPNATVNRHDFRLSATDLNGYGCHHGYPDFPFRCAGFLL
jgi:hypothetical protein